MTEPADIPEATSRGQYFARAENWARDRREASRRSRRIAWSIAVVACAIAVLEAFALIGMAPLKTVVPYTVLVDRSTGYVEVLKGIEPRVIKPDSALTQSLLAQYVLARESFDIHQLNDRYRKVTLWSAQTARSGYLAQMPSSNPESPLNIYSRSTLVDARIESVSSLEKGRALVRFSTGRYDGDRAMAPAQRDHWVAVITFRFVGEPMSIEDRLANPLGFQVTRYHRDAEVPPQPDPASALVAPLADLRAADGNRPGLARSVIATDERTSRSDRNPGGAARDDPATVRQSGDGL
ncbi:VirB8/TrbF family protein [Sphingobium sp. AN558]|uniref:virB8 family protein n=1 Tax=Sphingobium sp. AN558 TaxID=3133442 RepID=UPI0030C4FF57